MRRSKRQPMHCGNTTTSFSRFRRIVRAASDWSRRAALSQPTLQLLNYSPEGSKHDTKRLKDTIPLLIFLRDLTVNTVFVSISIFVLAILRQRWQTAAIGVVLLLLAVLCRAQILIWVRHQLLTRAVLFLACIYLTVLFVVVLLV